MSWKTFLFFVLKNALLNTSEPLENAQNWYFCSNESQNSAQVERKSQTNPEDHWNKPSPPSLFSLTDWKRIETFRNSVEWGHVNFANFWASNNYKLSWILSFLIRVAWSKSFSNFRSPRLFSTSWLKRLKSSKQAQNCSRTKESRSDKGSTTCLSLKRCLVKYVDNNTTVRTALVGKSIVSRIICLAFDLQGRAFASHFLHWHPAWAIPLLPLTVLINIHLFVNAELVAKVRKVTCVSVLLQICCTGYRYLI